MQENYVGYLLNSLDDSERRAVESRLETDDQARRHVELLRQALDPLAADRDGLAPPPGLVVRTITRVAEHICRELPRAPRPASLPLNPEPSWWRRPDFLVAACLLITALGLIVPALFRSTAQQAQIAECQDQLRQYGQALAGYHDIHRKYPDVAAEAPRHVAGMMAPLLLQAGLFPKLKPSRAHNHSCVPPPAMDDLKAMDMDSFRRCSADLNPAFAYTLGHYQDGAYQPPRLPDAPHRGALPLMADTPPAEGDPGNSPNHGGAGQNVLFHDGHVKFTKTRNAGMNGDDIFLNKNNKVAAGLDPFDTVLGGSASKPWDK